CGDEFFTVRFDGGPEPAQLVLALRGGAGLGVPLMCPLQGEDAPHSGRSTRNLLRNGSGHDISPLTTDRARDRIVTGRCQALARSGTCREGRRKPPISWPIRVANWRRKLAGRTASGLASACARRCPANCCASRAFPTT